jgi:hypothetical protein
LLRGVKPENRPDCCRIVAVEQQIPRSRLRRNFAAKSPCSDHDFALLQEHPTKHSPVALEAGYWQRYICKAAPYWKTRKIGFVAWPCHKRRAGGHQGELECGSIDGTF